MERIYVMYVLNKNRTAVNETLNGTWFVYKRSFILQFCFRPWRDLTYNISESKHIFKINI